MVHYPVELGSNVSQSDRLAYEGAWNGKTKTGEGGGGEGARGCADTRLQQNTRGVRGG